MNICKCIYYNIRTTKISQYVVRVFDDIFILNQVGSGQAMAEPMYSYLFQLCLPYEVSSAISSTALT